MPVDGKLDLHAVAAAIDSFGSLDVVVNNAGYGLFGAADKSIRKRWGLA